MAVSLASQRFEDFTEAMIEFATNVYICNRIEANALDNVCAKFSLSSSERHALEYEVHGATREGASFLFKSETKSGSITQVLVNNLGLLELWALGSTAEDAQIRRALLKKIPYFPALQCLAKKFPTGSCKKVIERAVEESGKTSEAVVDELITSLLHMHQQMQDLNVERNDLTPKTIG